MKVSVVISIFNEEKYIERCIDSLLEQKFRDFELIIIDDGSKDKTWEVLSSIQHPASSIQKFKIKHGGPAKARNFGASKAKGEILVFVDGDMYFDRNFISDLVEPIISDDVKGTYSTEEYIANWENAWARCWNYNWNLPDKKRINEALENQANDFRAILKSEFKKVTGFSSTGYADTWSLANKLGYKPLKTNALYYHYNPSSLAEVFLQAKWVVKRDYKLGFLGKIIGFLRLNIVFSLIIGFKKSIQKKEPAFLIFKIVYDCAGFLGLLENFLLGKRY